MVIPDKTSSNIASHPRGVILDISDADYSAYIV